MDRTATAHGRGASMVNRRSARTTKDADFTAWLRAREGMLLRRARLLCADASEAEDLVQQTAAKVYLAWDRLLDHNALDAYALRIMVNEHHTWWRRAWRTRERSTGALPERVQDAQHDRYDEGLAAEVWQAVTSLPPRQRAVIVLRYYEGLSEAEIADALGVHPGTVKSQAVRALKTLRAITPLTLDPREESL